MVLFTGVYFDQSVVMPIVLIESLYLIGVIVSLTHMGKKTMIKQMNLVSVDTFPYKDHVLSCVQSVVDHYANHLNKEIELEVFMVKEKGINAVAFGWNCLAIYPELLSLEKREVEAVIAHELGHIVHKDSVLLQLNYVANNVFLIFGYIINYIIFILLSFFNDKTNRSAETMSRFITFIMYGFIVKGTQYIMEIIYKKVMRGNEFYADRFACQIGYKEPLLSVVSRMNSKRDAREQSSSSTWLNTLKGLFDTHPSNAKRKKAIESYR
jgi:heat shock protein HtpX